jgi:hypothetical protein
MKKVLKWILYILLGLVVLSVVAGFVAMLFGGYGFGYGMMRPGFRMMEPSFRMMGAYNYHRPIGILFGGLLCLGVILLVIVGIVALVYALVNRNKPAKTTTPAQINPAPDETTPISAETTAPAETTASLHTCPNCGRPSQEDWKTCPYCGNPLV